MVKVLCLLRIDVVVVQYVVVVIAAVVEAVVCDQCSIAGVSLDCPGV